MTQTEPHIGGTPVLLASVAGSASRNDVVPGMGTTAALGDDVIDVLGRTAAVLALVVVPHENRPPGERSPGAVRDLHEVVESHDTGSSHLEVFRAEDVSVGMYHLSLAFQGKDQRPPDRNDAQRLVRGVEDQRSPQSEMSIYSGQAVTRFRGT